jgi:hypothetical protein
MRKLLIAMALWFSPLSALAVWFGGEFSADVMAYNPQTRQWEQRSKIYVGENAMRMDMQQGMQTITNVLDAKTRTMYSINPSQQAYMQMTMPQGNIPMLMMIPMPGEPGSPCQTPKISCNMLGEEQVNGIPTQKWEMVDQRDPLVTARTVRWLDPTRQMLIKSEEPGNVVTERRLLGDSTIGGRQAEKWETTFKKGDQVQRTVSFIDPKLHLEVRMEAGNQVLALNNLQEKDQPESLFQIPKNYRRVTPEEVQRSTMGGQARPGQAGSGQMRPAPMGPGQAGGFPGR